MTSPLLFVQENSITRLSHPLAQAWRERGWEIESLCFDPKKRYWLNREPTYFHEFMPTFVYGSVSFVDRCSHHPSLAPWTFANTSDFDPSYWGQIFGFHMLNWPRSMPVWGLVTTEGFHREEPFHARPTNVHKGFQGGVYTLDEFLALNLPSNMEVSISKVREISAEFRVWIVGGKVAEISQYRCFGKPAPAREGILVDEARIAAQFFAERRMLEHVVMDIGLISEREDQWKIIEFNPINSSGWYAADIGKIIDSFVEYYR